MPTQLQSLAQSRITEAVNTIAVYGAHAPFVSFGQSEDDKLHVARVDALLARGGLTNGRELQGNPFAAYTLMQLASDAIERVVGPQEVPTNSTMKLSQAFAHAKSDFPKLLRDTAAKAALRGFDEAAETYRAWTTSGFLANFRPTDRAGLGAAPPLLRLTELAEFKHGTFNDRREVSTLASYGRLFEVSRAAMIADQVGALTRVPLAMGRAAARLIGDLAYAALTSNPTMGDGVALFHASHGNLLSGAAIDIAAVDAMRAAINAQTDNGVRLNIRPRFMVVPIGLEAAARALLSDVPDLFEVVADGRLDADSATAWYMVADPGQFDTIEVAFLNGDSGPRVEQTGKFSVDSVSFKVALDVAVTPLEYRTMAKNPGA